MQAVLDTSDFSGNMDMCIAIRTIVFKDRKACIQAGCGIVYDSCPEREYEEIQNKRQGIEGGARMILVIDNGDSFAYNIYQCVGEVFPNVRVVSNLVAISEIQDMNVKGIVMSSGPGRAKDAGNCVGIVKELSSQIPILGIGLGMEVIGCAYGGGVLPDVKGMHGKTSIVLHDGKGIFMREESNLTARYHSFKLNEIVCLMFLKYVSHLEGTIMAVRHKSLPLWA